MAIHSSRAVAEHAGDQCGLEQRGRTDGAADLPEEVDGGRDMGREQHPDGGGEVEQAERPEADRAGQDHGARDQLGAVEAAEIAAPEKHALAGAQAEHGCHVERRHQRQGAIAGDVAAGLEHQPAGEHAGGRPGAATGPSGGW